MGQPAIGRRWLSGAASRLEIINFTRERRGMKTPDPGQPAAVNPFRMRLTVTPNFTLKIQKQALEKVWCETIDFLLSRKSHHRTNYVPRMHQTVFSKCGAPKNVRGELWFTRIPALSCPKQNGSLLLIISKISSSFERQIQPLSFALLDRKASNGWKRRQKTRLAVWRDGSLRVYWVHMRNFYELMGTVLSASVYGLLKKGLKSSF